MPDTKYAKLLNHAPQLIGYALRWMYYKPRLGHLGKNVRFDSGVTITDPRNVRIGDYSWIGTHTVLEGARGIEIGRYVHVVTLCHLQGGGTLKIGDYVSISSGSKIYSDTVYYTKRCSSAVPLEQQEVVAAPVVVGKDAFLGLNCTVLPGVTIGEGAFVGANSLVNRDIPPWSIAVGSPARVIGTRERLNLPEI